MRDCEMFEIIEREENRQKDNVELIASENFVSSEVREAQGSVLTNKYAEGYPGKRYYGGCVYVDQAEDLARKGHLNSLAQSMSMCRLIPDHRPICLFIRPFLNQAIPCLVWT